MHILSALNQITMKKIAVLAMTFCFLFAASQVDAQTKKDNKQTTVSKKESKKSASDQTVANSTKINPKLDSFKQRRKKENSDQTNAKTATTTKTASTTTKAST